VREIYEVAYGASTLLDPTRSQILMSRMTAKFGGEVNRAAPVPAAVGGPSRLHATTRTTSHSVGWAELSNALSENLSDVENELLTW